jgi:AcrR family transcriptional regulator
LENAAMALYLEAGFEQTTVADIAERASLTERTFFRHFSDKREVLFSGASALQELMVVTVRNAPAPIAPLNIIALALNAAGSMIGEERDRSRLRQQVIDANDDLKERELIKLAALASAMAHELRDRGVDEPTASLAAEVGIAAFRIAFERWVRGTEEGDLVQMIGESVAQLSVITGQQ